MYYMVHSVDENGEYGFKVAYDETELQQIESTIKGKYMVETVQFLRRGENQ